MARPDQDKPVPNPGSQIARDEGCVCPRMGNNNGKWAPYPPDGWWIVVGCPMHSPVSSGERS